MPVERIALAAGEEGAGYIYYGGSSFPPGDKATSQCPQFSLVTPCPADVVICFTVLCVLFVSLFFYRMGSYV